MKRPDDQALKSLAMMVRAQPEILDWVRSWRDHELGRLPHVVNTPAIAQGRCQVLIELCEIMEQSPEHARGKG